MSKDSTVAHPAIRGVTPDEVARYHDNGWVHLPGLVDKATIAAWLAAAKARADADTASPPPTQPPDATLERFFSLHADLALADKLWGRVSLSSAMARNIEALIQAPQVRFYLDVILAKEPQGNRHGETNYHQDYSGHSFDRSNWGTLWIALSDLSANSGTMRFYSRSHHLGSLGEDIIGVQGGDVARAAGYALSDPVDMKAGDASFHNSLLMHGAPANRTNTTRWAYAALYIDERTHYTGAPFWLVDMQGLKPRHKVDGRFPILE